MRFRTLALALALCCGLTVVGEAASKIKKPSVRRQYQPKKFKAKKFKAGKPTAKRSAYKAPKKRKG